MADQDDYSPSDKLFDTLEELSKSPVVKYDIELRFKNSEPWHEQDLASALDTWRKAEVFEYELTKDKGELVATLRFYEPTFTNYTFTNLARLHNKNVKLWLHNFGTDFKPLDRTKTYTASLYTKPNTSDAYLRWDNGEQFMYHFRTQSSSTYVFFKYLTENHGRTLFIDELKAINVVRLSEKKLHEIFSKTFIKGLLKERFVSVSEADRVMFNGSVQLTGDELARIIRRNIISLSNEQMRYIHETVNKFKQL